MAHPEVHLLKDTLNGSKTFRFCPHCDASLSDASKFCGNCGKITEDHKETLARDFDKKDEQDRNRTAAVVSIFIGILMAITVAYISNSQLGFSEIGSDIVLCLGQVLAGVAAIQFLGKQAFRQSFGRSPDARSLGLGLLLPILTLPVAYLYVGLFPDAPQSTPLSDSTVGAVLLALLLTAVQPALFEEWLCRGILWVTIRPITSRWTAILLTATVFAFLHGLNGAFLLEIPHRFAMGLALGWLRARSASLWPCVLAHFVHNGVAVLLG